MLSKVRALSGPWARWMGVGLIVMASSACREQLHARVSERDANEILATLYVAGIGAGKSTRDEETWAVEVEAQDLQRALQVLQQHGLPREQFASTGDIFKKEGLVSTPAEERIRFLYAMSQELSHTLSQIDGVLSARVHPVIPANDPLANEIRPASASVFIKHRHDANLQAMAPAIKNLVMRGIEGLAYDNIALTFVAAEEPAAGLTAPIAATSAWARPVVGALTALLLLALGALAYLWSKYRSVSARGRPASVPSAAKPVQADEDHDVAHDTGNAQRAGRSQWFTPFRSRWRESGGASRQHRAEPDLDSYPSDASTRQAG